LKTDYRAGQIMKQIGNSVGMGGYNAQEDVALVQSLLVKRGYQIGEVDGRFGTLTKTAIITFQSGFMPDPDGRIDPGGMTWRSLSIEPGNASLLPAGGSLTRLVQAPVKSAINGGLTAVNNKYMIAKLGEPRSDYSTDCQPLTNVKLKRHIVTASVGPFRVSGLKPAVLSLQVVFGEIYRAQPEVYAKLGTAGMLCCRYTRDSTTSISNHSWGTALDLTIDNVLDKRGDGRVQYGLTLIAPIFNQFGWYWGATFATEDGMHFEASRALVDAWADQLI
jgi:hypothetical protein